MPGGSGGPVLHSGSPRKQQTPFHLPSIHARPLVGSGGGIQHCSILTFTGVSRSHVRDTHLKCPS